MMMRNVQEVVQEVVQGRFIVLIVAVSAAEDVYYGLRARWNLER